MHAWNEHVLSRDNVLCTSDMNSWAWEALEYTESAVGFAGEDKLDFCGHVI